MPVLRELADLDPERWVDADLVPRPLVTIGSEGIVMADLDQALIASLGRRENTFHRHRKGQLVLSLRGALTCEVEQGLWLVPSQSAIWVPGGMLHKIDAEGTMACYVAYIDPAATQQLPTICCSLTATPLLRELLIRSASMPVLYEAGGMDSRLVSLLLDEIAIAAPGKLHLPIPGDARLRKIIDMIINAPADRGTIQTWARQLGLGERTLARLLVRETGMSFGRWRQQLHLMLAVKRLEAGASVQQVADDLGYESAGGFVTMFRKALGTTPGRYVMEARTSA